MYSMTASPKISRQALVATARDAQDLANCQAILAEGSKSFAAASLLLPARIRSSAAAVYAFCRVSDDLVDLGQDPDAALQSLHQRLDLIAAGLPEQDPVDRALAVVLQRQRLPKSIFAALLDGYRWDAEGRDYDAIEELEAYCARVASSVGVMMTLLMGPRDPEVLARATDLGLAMQLTNIARDVGEDARAGRLYLPKSWLREEGLEPEQWLAAPVFNAAIASVVKRLLDRADAYYLRADLGISQLPRDSRLAIRAARLIYADIGRVIRRNNYNSVDQRAYTSKARKLWLMLRALPSLLWRRQKSSAPAAEANQFLLAAVVQSSTPKAGESS